MNTVDKLKAEAEKRLKDRELSDEEMQELQKACRLVFSSKEGKLVAKYMLKVSGLYKYPDFNLDPSTMAFQKGMLHIVKFFVIGMLDKESFNQIERN